MDRANFLHPDNWSGGPTYDLAIAWPPGSDQQILSAIVALWRAPGIAGPWRSPSHYPELSPIATTFNRETGISDYGLLTLADGTGIGCIIYTVQDEYPTADSDWDWLFVGIYRGMQERAFDFVYADRLRKVNPWLESIDARYLAIADCIFETAPFSFATIDFEGFALFDRRDDILTELYKYGMGCLLPYINPWKRRTEGWLERPSGLRWLPSRAD